MEKVVFSTEDSVFIAGDLYRPHTANGKGVLLLHMMPADRKSWNPLATLLQSRGYQVLAIDLRGHGESVKQGERTISFKQFYADEEHQASRLDVEAAVSYLHAKGISDDALIVGGASIGANLALGYAAYHRDVSGVVLLSPGLVYHGIQTESAIKNLEAHQRVLMVVSEEDAYSAESVRTLADMGKASKEIKWYNGLGHGTSMLEKDLSVAATIAAWMDNTGRVSVK